MKRALSLLALLLAALIALPASAQAAPYPSTVEVSEWAQGERILSWRSDIQVRADSALDVAETITINAEGDQINHGILRDFPTTYSRDGRRVRVGFDVASVERDGQPEPYVLESAGNGVRVRIGDADTYIPHGRHTYVIRYSTTGQLGFFDGFDELYWNVTGTGWVFPIDQAEARVRLPQAVPFGRERAFYTGSQGATASNATVVSEQPGEILIRSTEPLGPYEGLTIAVRWPKGVVVEPPRPSQARRAVQDQAPYVALLPALLGLLLYYYAAWKQAGRGPRAGPVVPLFTPPDGLSAAATRFVKRMAYDDRCFAAAIVESGVHGRLKLVEGEKPLLGSARTTLVETRGQGTVQPPEEAMLGELFLGSGTIEMDDANHERFGAARSALQSKLADAYKDTLFVKNYSWAWLGIAVMVAAMLLVACAIAFSDFYTTPLERLIPAAGLVLALAGVFTGLRLDGRKTWPFPTLLGVAALALLGIAFVRLTQVEEPTTWAWILAPLVLLPLVISAFVWMAAPTVAGRAVMDRIAGFEHYLSVTEEDRLETLHPPEKTPELFERYLPYAIALGVENRWADKFAHVLAAAAADPSQQHGGSFGWYSGSSNAWSNPSRFAGAVGASLVSGVASASTAPGSSSGSGGGGSSGGGGGGGGGGGW
jgi:hypothetical protein